MRQNMNPCCLTASSSRLPVMTSALSATGGLRRGVRPAAGSWVDGSNAQPAADRSLFGDDADRGVVLGDQVLGGQVLGGQVLGGQVLDALGVRRGPGGRSAVVVA
jgi:hypothetical protein